MEHVSYFHAVGDCQASPVVAVVLLVPLVGPLFTLAIVSVLVVRSAACQQGASPRNKTVSQERCLAALIVSAFHADQDTGGLMRRCNLSCLFAEIRGSVDWSSRQLTQFVVLCLYMWGRLHRSCTQFFPSGSVWPAKRTPSTQFWGNRGAVRTGEPGLRNKADCRLRVLDMRGWGPGGGGIMIQNIQSGRCRGEIRS